MLQSVYPISIHSSVNVDKVFYRDKPAPFIHSIFDVTPKTPMLDTHFNPRTEARPSLYSYSSYRTLHSLVCLIIIASLPWLPWLPPPSLQTLFRRFRPPATMTPSVPTAKPMPAGFSTRIWPLAFFSTPCMLRSLRIVANGVVRELPPNLFMA